MRHCYLCDSPIPVFGFRRWVTTGGLGYGRIYVSRRGISGSSTGGQRTGLRTVCSQCAQQIDDAKVSADNKVGWVVLIVLGLFAVSMLAGAFKEPIDARPPRPPVHFSEAPNGPLPR